MTNVIYITLALPSMTVSCHLKRNTSSVSSNKTKNKKEK